MKTMQVEGVGELILRTDHWEGTPSALGGATLDIEGAELEFRGEQPFQLVTGD